jgi:hypothetical protein
MKKLISSIIIISFIIHGPDSSKGLNGLRMAAANNLRPVASSLFHRMANEFGLSLFTDTDKPAHEFTKTSSVGSGRDYGAIRSGHPIMVLEIIEQNFYNKDQYISPQDIQKLWINQSTDKPFSRRKAFNALRLLAALGIIYRFERTDSFSFIKSPYKELSADEKTNIKRKLVKFGNINIDILVNAEYTVGHIAQNLQGAFHLFSRKSKEEFIFGLLCGLFDDVYKLDDFAKGFVIMRDEIELDNILQYAGPGSKAIFNRILYFLFNNFDTQDGIHEAVHHLKAILDKAKGQGLQRAMQDLLERIERLGLEEKALLITMQNMAEAKSSSSGDVLIQISPEIGAKTLTKSSFAGRAEQWRISDVTKGNSGRILSSIKDSPEKAFNRIDSAA